MITLMGHLDISPVQAGEVFADFQNWPSWMSGVQRVEVPQHNGDRARLAVWQAFKGREFYQELDVNLGPGSIRITQLKGSLKKWQAHWQFTESPNGQGTTLRSDVEVEIGGPMGLFVTQRMMEEFLNQAFHESVKRLEKRARSLADNSTVLPQPDDNVILQLYETDQGLELWYQGEFYPLQKTAE